MDKVHQDIHEDRAIRELGQVFLNVIDVYDFDLCLGRGHIQERAQASNAKYYRRDDQFQQRQIDAEQGYKRQEKDGTGRPLFFLLKAATRLIIAGVAGIAKG